MRCLAGLHASHGVWLGCGIIAAGVHCVGFVAVLVAVCSNAAAGLESVVEVQLLLSCGGSVTVQLRRFSYCSVRGSVARLVTEAR